MYRLKIIDLNQKSTHTHEIEKVIPVYLPASEYDCVEDEVAMVVIYTVIVGVASKLVSIIIGFVVTFLKRKSGVKRPGSVFDIP